MLAQPKIDVWSPITPTASFDPPVVRPGGLAVYRVTLNALEVSVEWPEKLPAPPGLDVQPGGHGQLLTMAGTNMQPHTAFNYRVRPTADGRFTIPEFTINVYGKPVVVPAAQLQVISNAPPAAGVAQELSFELPSGPVYVGQSVRARIRLPTTSGALAQVQLNGQGFIVDQTSARQVPRPVAINGRVTFYYEISLTPISVGKLSLFAQAFTLGNRAFGGGVVLTSPTMLPGGAMQYTLLDSEPAELTVRPLPREGELPGFTGGVGAFRVDPPLLPTKSLRVGEPVDLHVRVRGDGNLVRLVPPPPPRLRDWQVLPGVNDSTIPQIVHAQGFTTFSYTLVPLRAGTQSTPLIPFSCFDPREGVYVDRSIQPVKVTVAPGKVPADLKALVEANASVGQPEPEPTLHGLAATPGLIGSIVPFQRQTWFPLVQLAPAAAFLGLWSWERRRRFCEQHPDVVRRGRARRRLHRELRVMRKVARAGNTPAYAAAAVSAMRVACSPHYPAEPRALVGADVLAILPEAERSARAGEVVRRVFDVTDASRFGEVSAEPSKLLALQPEIERVLRILEEKLCG